MLNKHLTLNPKNAVTNTKLTVNAASRKRMGITELREEGQCEHVNLLEMDIVLRAQVPIELKSSHVNVTMSPTYPNRAIWRTGLYDDQSCNMKNWIKCTGAFYRDSVA